MNKGKRAEAKAAGLAWYFTGQPCKRGHICERQTANGICHQCMLDDKQTKRRKEGRRLRSDITAETHAAMRVCSACNKAFPNTEEFFVKYQKKQWTGFAGECRDCRNKRNPIYYVAHREQEIKRAIADKKERRKDPEYLIRDRKWSRECARRRLADPIEREKHNTNGRTWRKANPERAKQFKHEQPAMKAYRAMVRCARKRQAMPSWADKEKIKEIYRIAQLMTCETDIEHHVDHYYPLAGKEAFGLHVHWNLRVMPGPENIRKLNKLPSPLLDWNTIIP